MPLFKILSIKPKFSLCPNNKYFVKPGKKGTLAMSLEYMVLKF